MRHVHGTYPLDGLNWRVVRRLKDVVEAAGLLGLSLTAEETEQMAEGDEVYLWLNKGYRAIGHEPTPNNGFLFEEMFLKSPEEKRFEIGTLAVYLADGRYLLIERVK